MEAITLHMGMMGSATRMDLLQTLIREFLEIHGIEDVPKMSSRNLSLCDRKHESWDLVSMDGTTFEGHLEWSAERSDPSLTLELVLNPLPK